MKHYVAAALAAALLASPGFAQDKQAPAKQSAEQQKRADECTKQARERNLQGRERTQFMTSCLRGEAPKK